MEQLTHTPSEGGAVKHSVRVLILRELTFSPSRSADYLTAQRVCSLSRDCCKEWCSSAGVGRSSELLQFQLLSEESAGRMCTFLENISEILAFQSATDSLWG